MVYLNVRNGHTAVRERDLCHDRFRHAHHEIILTGRGGKEVNWWSEFLNLLEKHEWTNFKKQKMYFDC